MELKIHEGYKKENMDDNSNIPSSNESLGKIWDHIIKNIGLTELVYNTFFADSKALSIKEDVFTVVVPMEFAKRPLKDHTLSIEEKLKNIYNKNIKFEVICENEVKDYNLGISNTKEKENTTDKKTGLKSEFTFNNFVVGESNKHAHSAALATALEPGYSSYNPLFFYSSVGMGKTHLMQAIGNFVLENKKDTKIYYIACSEFITEFTQSLVNKTTDDLKNKYKNLDLFLLDDVQSLEGKKETQNAFFEIFNSLVNNGKQVVMCSDRPPAEINDLAERIRNRMISGIIIDIGMPKFETRMAIIRKKAENLNVSISDEAIETIAANSHSSIREMEGLLNRVVLFSKVENMPITKELAYEAIKDIIKNEKPVLDIDYIVKTVAEYYDVPEESICSKTRKKPTITYRQIAIYLTRKLLDTTLNKIGSKFGGMNHSTVSSTCDKITLLIETNKQISEDIEKIEKNIKENT
ncbi:MAG: chromosomal replication initiator protein DnaA [Firmicutes bacterium]|nr:chromosomal replication initiator protein DnaA [Bacillota bacterium]